jgi:hypothetical protein
VLVHRKLALYLIGLLRQKDLEEQCQRAEVGEIPRHGTHKPGGVRPLPTERDIRFAPRHEVEEVDDGDFRPAPHLELRDPLIILESPCQLVQGSAG